MPSPHLTLRNAVVEYLDGLTLPEAITLKATHRPIVDLAAEADLPLVNVLCGPKRTEEGDRSGPDHYYGILICTSNRLAGETLEAQDTALDAFLELTHAIATALEQLELPGFAWFEQETPTADQYPFVAQVFDNANHLYDVILATFLET